MLIVFGIIVNVCLLTLTLFFRNKWLFSSKIVNSIEENIKAFIPSFVRVILFIIGSLLIVINYYVWTLIDFKIFGIIISILFETRLIISLCIYLFNIDDSSGYIFYKKEISDNYLRYKKIKRV